MSKILIIGGYGYIGSRLFWYLLDKKYDVEVCDLGWFGNPLSGIYSDEYDYKDLCPECLADYDAIVLLAGHSSVQMCENNTLAAYRNNVRNFIELVEKIKTIGGNRKFIYASSSSVYGNTEYAKMEEDYYRYVPYNVYDLSKHEVDLYMHLEQKVEYYGLRFGTVNGWSPNLRTDVMMNAMSETALNKGVINIINPEVWRPILDIEDCCRAIELIIENGDFTKRGIYNLATFNNTVGEIGKFVADYYKVPSHIIHTSNAKCEENGNCKLNTSKYNFQIDCRKFCETFKFEPQGSMKSILDSLMNNSTQIKGSRSEKVIYE